MISAFVFQHEGSAPLVHQTSEVRETLWVPMRALSDPARHVHKAFRGTGNLAFPGIVVGDPDRHIVWGLTYRFLEVFHRVAGMPFPSRWEAIEQLSR